jgi:hypothetical protein
MTDPTPEEMAKRVCQLSLIDVEHGLVTVIRAAVEAERYRTLQEMVEGITVERGHCSVCDRVVAAIRVRGDKK